MKIKLPYLVLMSCLMFAGQVWAQTPDFLKKRPKTTVAKTALHSSSSTGEPPLFPMRSGIIANDPAAKQAARPTRIYRKYPPVPSSTGFYNLKEKYECEYDNYGHITSLKIYEWNKSQEDYTFKVSVVSEYYQLPNGEFVKTKEEYEYYGRSSSYFEKQRYTSAYDDNGMQLWYQSEIFDHSTSVWNTISRTEARLENGIRTAIIENGEVDSCYTFDSKGRIAGFEWKDGREKEMELYTWDDSDRLVEVSRNGTADFNDDGLPDDTYSYIYTNIEIAHNEKYFNPYSLNPLVFDATESESSNETAISWGNFSIDDYTLHGIYYNMDATGVEGEDEIQGQMRTTVSEDGNTITQRATEGTEIMYETTTSLLDGYGSYRILREESDLTSEQSVSYNQYGELESNHLLITWKNDDGEEQQFAYNYIYDREYDNQNRPVKTTYYNNSSDDRVIQWEETYDKWTTVGLPAGIRETSPSVASIYPNPAAKNISISGIYGKTSVTLSDINGRVVLTRNINGEETLSVARLPAGLYLVNIQAGERVSTIKFIKY